MRGIQQLVLAAACACALAWPDAMAASPKVSFGAAPTGDASKVATRIIKENFDACKKVTSAKRLPDGTIMARCAGSDFRVFTAFKRDEGKTIEVALNCTVLKKRLDVDC